MATAQARATGRIVTAMPALGVAALYVADRSGFDLLVRSPLGWLALLVSAGLAALGHAAHRAHLGGRPVIALLLLAGAGIAFSAARARPPATGSSIRGGRWRGRALR